MPYFYYFTLFYTVVFCDIWLFFSKISGLQLRFYQRFLLGSLFVGLNFLSEHNMLMNQVFFITMGFVFLRHRKATETIFYALFSMMMVESLYRSIIMFFIPVCLGYSSTQVYLDIRLLLLSYLLVLPIFFFLSYIFSVDIALLKFITVDKMRRWVALMNAIMFSYYFSVYLLNLSFISEIALYQSIRPKLILIYLLMMIWFIIRLDRFTKDDLERKLALAQGERVENLVNYNHYIEQLYRDIRTIKHDSENILISLKDSIDSGNRKEIKEVYNAVVKESAYAMFSPEVGFGALGNIKEAVIRSLLQSKLLEAQNHGITLHIEIPDEIDNLPLKLLDLVVVLSILLDNAIDTAKGSNRSFISIAYFYQDNKQFFIIENSTKLKQIDMATLFNEHHPDATVPLSEEF
ncbi:GHKL domain-containing protein [Streptococcus iniae]